MVKTQLFIDMLEAGRVTSVTSAHGTKRTCGDVCYLSAFRDKADISQRLSNNRDLSVPALENLFGEFTKLVGDGTGQP
jgi:hypothetical protein